MKIALNIIATNKYTFFLEKLIDSADRFFMPKEEIVYFIYSDKKIELNTEREYRVIEVEHKKWPWMTLGRYEIFTNNIEKYYDIDYIYYCDVDMLFVNEIDNSILSDSVATLHPYFIGKRGTPETNPNSTAYISDDTPMMYFAGGFNGGKKDNYLNMSKIISDNIKKDISNNIIAIWHDESHLNRFMVENNPTLILGPDYCFPENSYNGENIIKLLALDKDHYFYRDLKI